MLAWTLIIGACWAACAVLWYVVSKALRSDVPRILQGDAHTCQHCGGSLPGSRPDLCEACAFAVFPSGEAKKQVREHVDKVYS